MDFTHGGNVYKVAREKNMPIEALVDFSANINPLGLSPKGEASLKGALSGVLNYPDPDYVALKEALGRHHNCKPETIFLGNGGIDVIFFVMRALKPTSALILAPTFVEYERALLAVESQVTPYYLKKEEGFQLSLDDYLKEAAHHDCLVLCNPNNPTGQLISKEMIIEIATYCKMHKKTLIVDEAFMDFVENEILATAVPLIREFESLFILKSITKFFAVPGLRIGYVITQNDTFRTYYKETKEPWCINYFAETYTKNALLDKPYIDATKEYIVKERNCLFKALNNISTIQAYESQGNYIFFQYVGDKKLKEALEDAGVLIRSCYNYRGLDATYFRVAVKTKEENVLLVKAIERIENEREI